MKTKIFIFVLCLSFLTGHRAVADETFRYDTLRSEIDRILGGLDLEAVPTGILSEAGISLVYPDAFNGSPADSVYMDYTTWRLLYAGLYDSQVSSKSRMLNPKAVFSMLENRNTVAVMRFRYNEFKEDALSKGLLQYDHSLRVLRRAAGPAVSPYAEDECFAVAPVGGDVGSLVFSKDCFFSNTGTDITKIEVSFDGGRTFQTAEWDKQVSPPLVIASAARAYLTVFRVTFSDGKVMESRSVVNARQYTGIIPPRTSAWKKTVEEFAEIPATGSHSGGTIEAIYLNKEATGGAFLRPLIIVGDMDLSSVTGSSPMDLAQIGSLLNEGDASLSTLSDFYDIIYLKYNNGLDDLLRNGELFRDAIKRINENRFGIYSDDAYVIGLGMGGVVARIGINKMEQSGEDHRIHKFISVNSPFRGLNIPVGLQAAIKQIQYYSGESLIFPEFEKIKALDSFLKSKAIKQLLFYSIKIDGDNFSDDNYAHDVFVNNPLVHSRPSRCETVAITAGGNDFMQLHEPYTIFFDLNPDDLSELDIPFLVNMKMDIHLTARTLPDHAVEQLYYGRMKLKLKLFAFLSISINPDHKTVFSTKDMDLEDIAAGSYLSFDLFSKLDPILENAFKTSGFTLVPAHSAVDIPYTDISLDVEIVKGEIPFDRYYATDENLAYSDLSGLLGFLVEELSPKIVGNTTDMLGDTELYIDNFPDIPRIVNYTWTFKDKKFRTVSTSGVKAKVRPLAYPASDEVSVSIKFLQLPNIPIPAFPPVSVPAAAVSAREISIEGYSYISPERALQQLSDVPEETTSVEWSASEGIVLEEIDRESVMISTKTNVEERWIEAKLTVAGADSYVLRKTLHSAPLQSAALTLLVSGTDPETGADKYAFMVTDIQPPTIPIGDLDFCWNNDVQIYDEDGEIVPREDNDFPIVVVPVKGMGGIAKIETPGGTGACLDDLYWGLDSIITIRKDSLNKDWNEGLIVGPASADPGMFDPIPVFPAITHPSMAAVTMPSYSEIPFMGKAAGTVNCRVKDLFGNSVWLETYVEAQWRQGVHCSVSPNPADSRIRISVGNPLGEQSASPMGVSVGSVEITAELYDDQTLVRSLTFSALQGDAEMDVSGLSEGYYYLLLKENGAVVDRQTIRIQH